ncbi:hypothetical protein [Francisella tularensis]|uniref:hypothetical protein n=1 Tax=Francisella tularensis TaxID=263 RepID=UPI0000F591FB|nr:hypothetical protein [Francisella tularensis]ABO47009.1 hypothetical membrane protein [Francisella tularensis subsp. tularensis WY96-3418]AJI62719.1 hypothetical protein CH65_1460 [Francisella tularensis subsp. tularensis]AKH92268.1 membrane protein [Francisella tularensis subsp. tularensis WY-00W4114]AKU74138.1 hypothetical protein ACX55_122 [Francisella tularensis subsp. tularensis]EKM86275.1 hypothetical protein B344_06077 [Francisella tularensis subsp. tularensis 831]
MIFEYFKKLFSKWLSKFSVITGICGFVAFYSGYDPSNMVAKFIINNLLHVSLLFLIISSYQVWLEVQQELDKIKKNPVDYKITAKIQKIEINLENIRENYKKQFNEIESDINDCSSQINSLENPNDSPLHKLAGIDIPNFSNIMFQIMPNSKLKDEYTTNLKEYKKELESYNSKVENNLKAWKSFVDNDLRNIYIVDFSIENTGVKSDKNIDIEIELGKNSYISLLENIES